MQAGDALSASTTPPLLPAAPPARLARIALIAFEGTGHVHPMAALGAALKARGHRLVFPQLLDMEAKVRAAGLEFIPYAVEERPLGCLQELNRRMGELSGLESLRAQVQRAVEGVELQLRELPPLLLQHGPFDLLLVDSAQLGGSLIGERLGLPTVTVDLLPAAVFESSAPPWIFGWPYSDSLYGRTRNWLGNQLLLLSMSPLRRVLGEQRRQWGLPPPSPDPNQLWSSLLRISQMPEALDFPRRWWPPNFFHTGPFVSAAAREEPPFEWERLSGRRLVFASLGTLNNSSSSTLRLICAAFSGMQDVQLVLSTGGLLSPEALGLGEQSGGSESLIVVRMAPQLALISRAELVVTHCGINSVHEALLAGKPMVALPIASDQPGNARRLERIGVAEVIFPAQLTAARLRTAAQRVMSDPKYTAAAQAMQRHLQQLQGLERAVQLVEGVIPQSPAQQGETSKY